MGDIKAIGDKLLKSAYAMPFIEEMVSSDPFVGKEDGRRLKQALAEPALLEGRPDLQKLYHDIISRRMRVGNQVPAFRWYGQDAHAVQGAWEQLLDANQEPVWPKVRLGEERKANLKAVFAHREDVKPEGIVTLDAEDWGFALHLKQLLAGMPREEGMPSVSALFDAESRLLVVGTDGKAGRAELEQAFAEMGHAAAPRLLAVTILADRRAELIAVDAGEIDDVSAILSKEDYRERLSLLQRLFEPFTLNPWDAWHHPNPLIDAFATPMAFNPYVFIRNPFEDEAMVSLPGSEKRAVAGQTSFSSVVAEEIEPPGELLSDLEREASALADVINEDQRAVVGDGTQVLSSTNAGAAAIPYAPGVIIK